MTFKILFYIIFMTLNAISPANSTAEKSLPLCRDSPNCVSSQATDDKHFIEPFKIKGDTDAAWTAVKALLSQQSRVVVTHESSETLHAEATSLVFRFVDDINMILDAKNHVIHVRSASRTGHSDFGVNRKRLETLRAQLQKAQVVEYP